MSVTMVHLNSAKIENGSLKVDRKFHLGMEAYAEGIRAPLLTVNPEAKDSATMDLIEVPLSQLPYRIITIKTDAANRPLDSEVGKLRDAIMQSKLVYGEGLGSAKIARQLKIPYILILEYDLATQIIASTADIKNRLRRAVRAARCAWRYRLNAVADMRAARGLHCNGYPIYEATRNYNPSSLLYLDSRMARDSIMSRDALVARLASRPQRSLRMLFSGRYERMKGTDDAVRVAVECLSRGMDVEMHFYGQGKLRSEMERIASDAAPGRIHIHDSVPFTDLVNISRTFDLFVCCHIQSDPSCTYLESFGAGLPIVGYANRMWRGLRKMSGAGLEAPLGRPDKVADCVQKLLSDHQALSAMSERALAFAEAHCYELEFGKRMDALNAAIAN